MHAALGRSADVIAPHTAASHVLRCELRRRKVYRVAGGYAVVGWLLIQIAATIFPAPQLPAWTLRLIVIAILAGFPIALVVAWAFDVGLHGLKETRPGRPRKIAHPLSRRSGGTFISSRRSTS